MWANAHAPNIVKIRPSLFPVEVITIIPLITWPTPGKNKVLEVGLDLQSEEELEDALPSLDSALNTEMLDMLNGLGILDRTVETYKEQSQEQLSKINDFVQGRSSITNEERKALKQQVHALKGISFNSGAHFVGKLCEKLESQMYELYFEAIKSLVVRTNTALKRTLEFSKEVLERYN